MQSQRTTEDKFLYSFFHIRRKKPLNRKNLLTARVNFVQKLEVKRNEALGCVCSVGTAPINWASTRTGGKCKCWTPFRKGKDVFSRGKV